MMGRQSGNQDRLFYSFKLDDCVPQDHLLRSIDRFVDLSGIREELKPFYSDTGRPSIDPELMIRMLVVGYCFGTPASRCFSGLAASKSNGRIEPASVIHQLA